MKKFFAWFISHRFVRVFTLVEMLMALLIVSVILSASIPVITSRTKAQTANYNQSKSFPIGGVILWTDMTKLPDNTWLECNGQAIPNSIEYEQARRVFGARLPDLRNSSMEYINNLNNYLSKDIKQYLQNEIKPVPKDVIAIWGTNAAIPEDWSEATEYAGFFLRGVGGNSEAIGVAQGDAIRNITGYVRDITFGDAGIYSYTGPFYNLKNAGKGSSAGTVAGAHRDLGFDASRQVPVAKENRPVNKAVKFIKYTKTHVQPNIPEPPQSKIYYRYIAKVRY